MSTIAATIARTASATAATRTSAFVAACPQAQPHSVRARLHYMVGAGVLSRVAKGLYVAMSNGTMQVGFQADSTIACAELAAGGCKVDAIFLDVPYGAAGEGQGVKGGNRDIASFPVMHSTAFAPMAANLAKMMATDDSPAVLIMSNGKSSEKARTGYIAAMRSAGFQLVATGNYTKTYANGRPCSFGKYTLPTEGIYVFNKSGNAIEEMIGFIDPEENEQRHLSDMLRLAAASMNVYSSSNLRYMEAIERSPELIRQGWCYTHSFGVVHYGEFPPQLVLEDRQFMDGQQWAYLYFVIGERTDVSATHAEARALNEQFGLPAYFGPNESTALVKSVKAQFPQAAIRTAGHTAEYYAAKAALEQFHNDGDIDNLRAALHEIRTPDYASHEDYMAWIDRNLDGAELLEDPRKHPALSLTSSASILYGIEP